VAGICATARGMNVPDGSILISDDWNGAVYRVSYGNAKSASP
jgi:glucose/arabinose dehydrogenase